jgi:hypothetical protein
MTGRKTNGWLVAAMVAIFTLIATMLVEAPASARPLTPTGVVASSPADCTPTLAVPCPGWTREYHSDMTQYGLAEGTVDTFWDGASGLHVVVQDDFKSGYVISGYLAGRNGWVHGIDIKNSPAGVKSVYFPCPQDGYEYYWKMRITHSLSDYMPNYNQTWWVTSGAGVCGTPRSDASGAAAPAQPTTLKAGMNSTQASAVCKLRGWAWVARKKPGWRKIVKWNKRNDPDKVIWRCVKVKKRRSITS